jgi:hypothetical protein
MADKNESHSSSGFTMQDIDDLKKEAQSETKNNGPQQSSQMPQSADAGNDMSLDSMEPDLGDSSMSPSSSMANSGSMTSFGEASSAMAAAPAAAPLAAEASVVAGPAMMAGS